MVAAMTKHVTLEQVAVVAYMQGVNDEATAVGVTTDLQYVHED